MRVSSVCARQWGANRACVTRGTRFTIYEEDISAISLLSWVPLVNSLSLHTLLHFLLSFRYVLYVLPNSFAFACVKEAEEKSEDGPCKQEEIERREGRTTMMTAIIIPPPQTLLFLHKKAACGRRREIEIRQLENLKSRTSRG